MIFAYEYDLRCIAAGEAVMTASSPDVSGCSYDLPEACVLADIRSFAGDSASHVVRGWVDNYLERPGHHEIDGEYALSAYLRGRRVVALSRDWSGVGSLFYAIEGQRLIVSTDVYTVLKRLEERRFCARSCAEYLAYEYVSEPNTLFQAVFCVPRGSTLEIGGDGQVVNVGSCDAGELELDLSAVESGLRNEIRLAHHRRLAPSNGIYLSGGIDSTVMAVTLRRDLGLEDLHAFAFSTKGAEQDEATDAESVARQLDIRFERVVVDPNAAVDLPDILARSSFPYPGAIFLGAVAQRTGELGLSGINMFAGQDTRLHTPPYNEVDKVVLHDLLHSRAARSLMAWGARHAAGLSGGGRASRGFARLGIANDLPRYAATYFFHGHRDSAVLRSNMGAKVQAQLLDQVSREVDFSSSSREVFNDIVNVSWDRQYTSDIAYMTGVTASYGNHCSMPFYDRRLASYSRAIPMDLALRRTKGREGHGSALKSVNKYVLRNAYKGELSDRMVFRDKAVCVTNHLYMNGCMSPYVKEYFKTPVLLNSQLGEGLGLRGLYQRALVKDGRWLASDYEEVVETHNLLFLELIAAQYRVSP